MSGAAWLTLVVVVGSLAVMTLLAAPPELVLLGGVLLLVVAGVIDPTQAFGGFSNHGMLTVAALFVVAAGLRETGAVTVLSARLLGRPKSAPVAVARLVAPVLTASAFLNNTTIVAMLLPAVQDWARRIGIAPSRLLMPLSFATILGGTCTLIGTSTNLVVAGVVDGQLASHPGLEPLGMFDVTPLGVPVAIAGGLVLAFLAPRLLPDRRSPVDVTADPRHFTMEVVVPTGSRLAGLTVEDAGLRHLPGAFLMEIVRGDEVLAAVDGQERLASGDRLVFVGDVDAMVDLQRTAGLAAAPEQVFKLTGARPDRLIVEAVVSARNPLVGLSVRDGGFRTRYQAVVIAVARAGERVPGRIGDIVLRTGDILLLEAHRDFIRIERGRPDFYLASSIEGATPPRWNRAVAAMVILGLLVAGMTTEVVPTVIAAFLAAAAMVVTGCCTLDEARRALDLRVLVAIAASFGLGEAMQSSGLDVTLASLLGEVGLGRPWLALALVYVGTMMLTELVSNNTAAVLALPVALSVATQLDVSPMGFVFAVMMAASASFLTPIGYQTNLMVYNAGGYRPSDYVRLGLPLSVVTGAVTVALIPLLWPF